MRRLDELSCDPVAIVASIAVDEAADPRLRFQAAKELLGLILPRGTTRPGSVAADSTVDIGGIIARHWRKDDPAETS